MLEVSSHAEQTSDGLPVLSQVAGVTLQTACSLGIDLSRSLMLRATRVIE